jgi:hypothetical protein
MVVRMSNSFFRWATVTYIGVISSSLFGHEVAAQAPRRMQLDLEFRFYQSAMIKERLGALQWFSGSTV